MAAAHARQFPLTLIMQRASSVHWWTTPGCSNELVLRSIAIITLILKLSIGCGVTVLLGFASNADQLVLDGTLAVSVLHRDRWSSNAKGRSSLSENIPCPKTARQKKFTEQRPGQPSPMLLPIFSCLILAKATPPPKHQPPATFTLSYCRSLPTGLFIVPYTVGSTINCLISVSPHIAVCFLPLVFFLGTSTYSPPHSSWPIPLHEAYIFRQLPPCDL